MTSYGYLFLTGDRLLGYAYDPYPGYEDDRVAPVSTEVLTPRPPPPPLAPKPPRGLLVIKRCRVSQDVTR